jgi:hypothetical protein
MLVMETITVYIENNTKHINILDGYNTALLNVKVDGTYNYHLALEVRSTWQNYMVTIHY